MHPLGKHNIVFLFAGNDTIAITADGTRWLKQMLFWVM